MENVDSNRPVEPFAKRSSWDIVYSSLMLALLAGWIAVYYNLGMYSAARNDLNLSYEELRIIATLAPALILLSVLGFKDKLWKAQDSRYTDSLIGQIIFCALILFVGVLPFAGAIIGLFIPIGKLFEEREEIAFRVYRAVFIVFWIYSFYTLPGL